LPVRAANEAIRQWKSKPLSKQALIGVENRIGSSGKWAFGTELLSDGETCHSSPGAAFEQLNGKGDISLAAQPKAVNSCWVIGVANMVRTLPIQPILHGILRLIHMSFDVWPTGLSIQI
jgi:hypothetical protein